MMKNASFTIERGFTQRDRLRVAQLYWNAKSGQFKGCFGSDQSAIEYLRQVVFSQNSIIARDVHGKVIGLLAFKTVAQSFWHMDYAIMASAYGFSSAILRAFCLVLLDRNPRANEIMVDAIAVEPTHRRNGIAKHLLDEFHELAKGFVEQTKYQHTRYDISQSLGHNPELPLRCGYHFIERQRLWTSWQHRKFKSVITLRRPIMATPANR